MASFFGFGSRRDDSDIPLSSSSHHEDEQRPRDLQNADEPPPPSPHAPPPTHPSFSPTPALTSPGSNSNSSLRGVAKIDASTMPSIPNIHIFNPGHQQQEEQSADGNNNEYKHENDSQEELDHVEHANAAEDNSAYGTYPENEVDEETHHINNNPSMNSYGTAEEEQSYYYSQQQQKQQEAGYYQQQGGGYYHDGGYQTQQQPQDSAFAHRDATLDQATYSGSHEDGLEGYATATASQSMDEEPRPVESYDEGHNYPPYAVESVEYDEYDASAVKVDRRETSPEPLMNHNNDDDRQRAPDNSTNSTSRGVRSTPSSYTPGSARKLIERFRTPNRGDLAVSTVHVHSGKSPKSPLHEAIFTPKFKEIHDKTIRRRQDMQHHMQDLERRLAKLNADLTNNTMDREAHMCHFLRDHICHPMERASERIALEREYRTSPHFAGAKHWMHLSTRMSRLDRVMTLYDHVEIQTAMRDKLDQPYNELGQEIAPAYSLETTKSEKREGAMLRQFDAVAATAQRRYHEERAARHGSFEVVKQQLLAVVKHESDPARIEEAISKVKALRAKLEQERVERRMRDEHTKTLIEQDETSMKRAVLEAMGGDEIISGDAATSVRRTIAYY